MSVVAPPGPPPAFDYSPPYGPYLSVAHADADVVAVVKPVGLLSVPGKPAHLADCVDARAAAAWPGARIVHRLDMDTSGLILVARNTRAHRILSGQFAKRIVRKTYVARVWGEITEDDGEIDAPLRADWPHRPRQMICREAGRPALTKWRVLARAHGETRLELTPVTGRSHQLRVHLASIGHPILGDPIYAAGAALAGHVRMMLHAERLAWRSPADGAWTAAEAPAPF